MSNTGEMSASPELTQQISELVTELRRNTTSNDQLLSMVELDMKRRRSVDRSTLLLLVSVALLVLRTMRRGPT